MDNFKITMLANIVIETVYIICVTAAAIHFERPVLLLWWCLALFLSCSYEKKGGGEK